MNGNGNQRNPPTARELRQHSGQPLDHFLLGFLWLVVQKKISTSKRQEKYHF